MHTPEPDRETEIRDQADFDKAVARDGKVVLEWLAGFGVVAALLLSIIAISQSSQHNTVTVTSGIAPGTTSSGAASAPANLPTKTISLKSSRAASWGRTRSSTTTSPRRNSPSRSDRALDLRIDNTDEGEHSITSPEIGVNLIVKPGVHTYQIVVKEKGRFSWFCVIPCDDEANGWAMQHAGYMSGFITAT